MVTLSEKQGRINVKTVIEHPLFTNSILFLIITNAVLIGLETYSFIYEPNKELFHLIDTLILFVFIIEIGLRMIAYRQHFFKDAWSIFDLVLVAVSLLSFISSAITILRILRVFRVLRTITMFPSLKRLVKALVMSVPAISSTFVLIALLFYIYAVVGTILFGKVAPEFFGNLHLSLLTTFQLFTMDSWGSVVFRPIFKELEWSWIYFVSFILLASYILLNLFFGELVANAQKLANEEEDSDMSRLHRDISQLKEQNSIMHDKINALLEMSKNKG